MYNWRSIFYNKTYRKFISIIFLFQRFFYVSQISKNMSKNPQLKKDGTSESGISRA